jgi:cyclic pyranopterin phosphate synthase
VSLPHPVEGLVQPTSGALLDRFGRQHTYLRVSVTDRCNYRCVYCMPAQGVNWMKRDDLLSYEEIVRIVRVMSTMGIHRIRLTGGEPTVRRDLHVLIAVLNDIDGIDDISMTTNAHLLASRAQVLADAGLRRVNISLDTLDADQFRRITRGGDLKRVLAGIDACVAAGLSPIKINAVIVQGENEDQVSALVDHFAPMGEGVHVRFIEAMPFARAASRHVGSAMLRERLGGDRTLVEVPAQGGGPARLWKVRATGMLVGFISPMTEHFCEACNRLRLSADGNLRTCLSREPEPSLRQLLRDGMTDNALDVELRRRVWGKVAGHMARDEDGGIAFEGTMTQIGG